MKWILKNFVFFCLHPLQAIKCAQEDAQRDWELECRMYDILLSDSKMYDKPFYQGYEPCIVFKLK